jgi:glycosyltransferase involved in cell wall biosynthesis
VTSPAYDPPAASPTRIAFVLHVMQVAGAEMLVFETIRRLGGRIRPVVFCLDRVGQLGEELERSGVPVIAFDRQPGLDWRLFGRLAREIRERQIDVIHAHQYTPFFYSSVAARLSRRRPRVIFTEHGRHYPDVVSWKRRLANRLLFNRLADEITAVCEFSARSLADADGFPRSRIAVIPNGIEPDRYAPSPDRRALRQRLGLSPARVYIVIVARFHPVKDHATLLNAFAGVARVNADADLLLVGDGPLRGAIEQQIAALGIQSRVSLLGVRSDVADILRASDVFALSSVSEAASITLLEAMASGVPAIVTDVGGNPELVRANVDGLMVKRGDAAGFTAAMLQLIESPERRAVMGQSAAARVTESFTLDDTIRRYDALYRPIGAHSH